ncbi:hypothetical protein [Runella zeae]|uniref:hypothetical protein n=1 Tax=Runella zeae TaxID=94255 RepID=UPI00048AC17B|nr:hypothetical protein [Runella zeae]
MKSRILPQYGNVYHRPAREHNKKLAFYCLLGITVCLTFTCLYQWVAQRDMIEQTNRAILRQDSLEAVKLSQEKIIFLMRDTIAQLRKTNQSLILKKNNLVSKNNL